MTLEEHGETLMHHEAAGDISSDWTHDGDPYFFGRCLCGWHDPIDHRDIHLAEHDLAEHASREHSAATVADLVYPPAG
jgi:hypothetical protein